MKALSWAFKGTFDLDDIGEDRIRLRIGLPKHGVLPVAVEIWECRHFDTLRLYSKAPTFAIFQEQVLMVGLRRVEQNQE